MDQACSLVFINQVNVRLSNSDAFQSRCFPIPMFSNSEPSDFDAFRSQKDDELAPHPGSLGRFHFLKQQVDDCRQCLRFVLVDTSLVSEF